MKFFNSEYFVYKNNKLYCENVDLTKIIENTSTPVYVYSKKFFIDHYIKFEQAFSSLNHKIFYASKANYNINVIKIFSRLGSGIDVNSAGELFRALHAGVDPKNIIFSGVGKTKEEIKLALEKNILLIKTESLQEISLINKIAKSLNKIAPIAIRVNPNVNPATHPYISTGLAENKFGIDETSAIQIFTEASKMTNINLTGIDMHIGSQITKIDPYVEAVDKLVDIVNKLSKINISLSHIDIGGGMGINYNEEIPFTPKELADAIIPKLEKTKCKIFFEPGRYLTANGGCLLSKVLFVKQNLDRNFIIIDAAMNDLLRPSIYKAYHHIQPLEIKNDKNLVADIVGPICESGDFLAKQREIISLKPNDFLAIMSAGAYGIVMSSNYNARRRPSEVIVDGDNFYVVRERETYEQLLMNEKIIDKLF